MRTLLCALILAPAFLAGGCTKDSDADKNTERKPPQLGPPAGKGDAGKAAAGSPGGFGPPNAVPAKDGKVVLNPENTQIKFVGTKPDGKHDGGFKAFTGTVELDDKAAAPKAITLEIDTASIYTDTGMLTNHLKTKDFFDVAKFPKATFTSTKIEPAAKEGTYQVTGKLTLHGETKEISFPISPTIINSALIGNSTFEIDRQDFGMTYGKGKVNDKVSISVVVGTAGQ